MKVASRRSLTQRNVGSMKNLPLDGVTVLELGNSIAAPFAGEILGDLGADVIKVEKCDGGDDARKWGPPFWQGASAIFQSLNRNKRSVVVELRDRDKKRAIEGVHRRSCRCRAAEHASESR